ncbi:SRPBCC family protein [Streptosporangium sp. NPDC051022]|uniref:SRPBCC family protein n=1 Tax=Streptosporangium sp. NPDC051022 TaxID=3155752 RepID=UPI00342BC777
MRNIQHRLVDAPPERLGALLDQVGTEDDQLWPKPAWPPLVLDAGLTPGSRGGHGPISYSVTDYEPGRRVRLSFEPGSGLNGYHEFLITAQGPGRCRLTHTIVGTVEGRMAVLWPLVIRWMHEALVHDLFDNAERAATGRMSRRPARWSLWVRLLRRLRKFPAGTETST